MRWRQQCKNVSSNKEPVSLLHIKSLEGSSIFGGILTVFKTKIINVNALVFLKPPVCIGGRATTFKLFLQSTFSDISESTMLYSNSSNIGIQELLPHSFGTCSCILKKLDDASYLFCDIFYMFIHQFPLLQILINIPFPSVVKTIMWILHFKIKSIYLSEEQATKVYCRKNVCLNV